jgi:hypothetical protein
LLIDKYLIAGLDGGVPVLERDQGWDGVVMVQLGDDLLGGAWPILIAICPNGTSVEA